jgi:hypothetical protein
MEVRFAMLSRRIRWLIISTVLSEVIKLLIHTLLS